MLRTFIKTFFRWAQDNSATIADIFQHPYEWRRVFIYGINVCEFGSRLEEYINSQTEEYTIVVREKTYTTEQLCDDDSEGDNQAAWRGSLAIESKDLTVKTVCCELLVKSSNEVRIFRKAFLLMVNFLQKIGIKL